MNTIKLTSVFAAALLLPVLAGNHEASAGQSIHSDCADNPHPMQCTQIVEQLEVEMAGLRQAFIDGDVDEMMSYHDDSAVMQVFGQFYRGSDSIRNDLLVPLFTYTFSSMDLDLQTHWQVVSPDLIVHYGPGTAYVTLQDGSPAVLPEQVMVTWTRSPGDPDRPFRIASAYFQIF